MDLDVAGLPVRATCVHPGGMSTRFGASASIAGDLAPEGVAGARYQPVVARYTARALARARPRPSA